LLGELQFLQGLVSGLHLREKENEGNRRSVTPPHKDRQISRPHHLVGTSNLKGSSLGKQTLGEGVKLPALDGGRLGLSLLLDRCLPQLVSFGLHL